MLMKGVEARKRQTRAMTESKQEDVGGNKNPNWRASAGASRGMNASPVTRKDRDMAQCGSEECRRRREDKKS